MMRKLIFCLAIIIAFTLVLMNLSCDWPIFFRRNRNLRLLLKKEGYSMFNPVWAPNNKIYYLCVKKIGYIEDSGGQLRIINIDGSNDRLVLDGTFGALAISPDGSKLALTCGNIGEGGALIIADTLGNILDTISHFDSITDVEFNKSGNYIYYHVYDKGFYRFNLVSNIEERILPWGNIFGFDVYEDSLLFFLTRCYDLITGNMKEYGYELVSSWPQFNPNNPTIIVSAPGYGGEGEIYITDITKMKIVGQGAEPYWVSYIWFPYWSPDTTKIVFSASESRRGRMRPTYYELWVLEKIER